MDNQLPTIYVVVSGKKFDMHCAGKTVPGGALLMEPTGFEDRGILAAELALQLKLPKLPTVLQVMKGGRAGKIAVGPEGPGVG